MYLRDIQGFPGGSVVKNLPADAGDTGLIPCPGPPHMPQSNAWPCARTGASALELESDNYQGHRAPPLKSAHPGAQAPQEQPRNERPTHCH